MIQSAKNGHILLLEKKIKAIFSICTDIFFRFFYSQFRTIEMGSCALFWALFKILVYVSLVLMSLYSVLVVVMVVVVVLVVWL